MYNVTITWNGQTLTATYNSQSGYYEVTSTTPSVGGIYSATITAIDDFQHEYTQTITIQVLVKPAIKLDQTKVFMWIFSHEDFSIRDIVEIASYEINIDEETNANTTINVLKSTSAEANDIVAVKKNGEVIYWGIIEEILNEDGQVVNTFSLKYITNLFDRFIQLTGEGTIRSTGVEDFIGNTITNNWISNSDTFINLSWLEVNVASHTPKQTSVTNVENGIYNLHTWMTNCTQNYDIVYTFDIHNGKLRLTIKNETFSKEIIDTKAMSIPTYNEVFETDVTAKVIVLYDKKNDVSNPGTYTLYLKTDRTTTTDGTDQDRAEGKITTIYTENYEDANQAALDEMKSNLYNHNITFSYNKIVKVGTPIAIKTKKSIVYDSYISAVKITSANFYEYQCGNIRIDFINKLLKEKKNA